MSLEGQGSPGITYSRSGQTNVTYGCFLEGLRITVSNMDALTEHSNISTCQDA